MFAIEGRITAKIIGAIADLPGDFPISKRRGQNRRTQSLEAYDAF